jgi:hypothetical protein
MMLSLLDLKRQGVVSGQSHGKHDLQILALRSLFDRGVAPQKVDRGAGGAGDIFEGNVVTGSGPAKDVVNGVRLPAFGLAIEGRGEVVVVGVVIIRDDRCRWASRRSAAHSA